MSIERDRRVVIIGGGASGVLLACQLLRNPAGITRVTIVEKTPYTGLGMAYGTVNPHHLLNVRASNMSAFPDHPDHFWNWMVANNPREVVGCDGTFCFVRREICGKYLASPLEVYRERDGAPQRLHVVRGEVMSLRPIRSGVEVSLSDGSSHFADVVVLATGNEAPTPTYGPCSVSPWSDPATTGVMTDDAVVILGSGLTMVDYVLSLLQARHRGPILAISRRGLLPRVHRPVEPTRIDAADVPFGTEVSHVLKWLRDLIESGAARNMDWRGVIDGLRPFVRDIWQNWTEPAKRRFLRHARAWWDVHRHRMAPEVDRRLTDAILSGQLEVVAGKVTAIEAGANGATVTYRRRGSAAIEAVHVAKVVQCMGVDFDPRESANPVLQNLLEQGLARPDPLGIGIDVAADCAVVDRFGNASQWLFAVGPLTRGRFWEIISIPDIRIQCAKIADRIATRALVPAE